MLVQINKLLNIKIISVTSILTVLLVSINSPIIAEAVKDANCLTGSKPMGVTMDNSASNIWLGVSGNSKIGTSSTSSPNCSVSSYPGQNDPTHVAFSGGGGAIAFTQKGSGGSTTSCITVFNPVTHALSNSQCSNGAGFDDVSKDPTSSTLVWASLFYAGKIAKYDTSSGSITYYTVPAVSGCSSSTQVEGLRVDSFGNVWVANESCHYLDEYQPSLGFWSTYNLAENPYFLDIDNTNSLVWTTSVPYNTLQHTNMNTGVPTDVSVPSGETGPFGIAVDPANTRVDVTFQSGSVDEYDTYPTLQTWICNGGDSYTSSYPFGITTQSSNYYWATDFNNGKLLVGHC